MASFVAGGSKSFFGWALLVILTIHVVTQFMSAPHSISSYSNNVHKNTVQFSTTAHQCHRVPMENMTPHFRAQQGEDKALLTWFNGLCNGTYIEMGALDGERYSNTYVFNKVLHWKGLLVELSPINHKKLVFNRPNELATPVNAAVCSDYKTIHWYESKGGAVSGVWEFATPKFRARWWPGATLDNTTLVECVPLKEIIQRHVPSYNFFDVFSLDVEGSEFEVLQSLDFTTVGFGMIVVESSGHNPRKDMAVTTLLESNGYRVVKTIISWSIQSLGRFIRTY